MYRTISIVSVLLLISCSSTDNSAIHIFRIYEENGITIAESNDVPKYQGDLFQYEKVVEIRSDTTNQDAILYRPAGYTIDKDDLIYIADSGNHRIAVFNINGEYLRSIGREGDGPGEFRSPRSLFIIDNKLQIPEPSKQRTTIFNKDGTLDEVITYRHARSSSFVSSTIIASDGTRLIQRITEDRGESYISQSFGFCTMSSQGDTLAIIATPLISVMKRLDRGYTNIRFGRVPRAYPDPSRGIFLTTGSPPEVDWYNLEGELIKRICLLLDDELVTSEDKTRVRAYYDRQIAAQNQAVSGEFSESIPTAMLEQQRDSATFADVKAHWTNIRVDDYGFIWLEKHEEIGAPSYEPHVREYYILSPEGEFLGITSTPDVDHFSIDNGYLAAYVTDGQTGESVPTIYRIIPTVDGLLYQ